MSGEIIEHKSVPDVSGPRETHGTLSGDKRFRLYVNPNYRYAAVITPSTDLLLGGECDAISLLADGTVTYVPADDPAGGTVVLTLKAGFIWPISCAKITASSTTVTAHWHHKPVT